MGEKWENARRCSDVDRKKLRPSVVPRSERLAREIAFEASLLHSG